MNPVNVEKNNIEDKKIAKTSHAEREERILAFWKENHIFEKSLTKPSPKGEYIFYDGPPFANGLPHYGHLLAGIIKDVVPRFKTMRGYHVPRRWGWDCHGLPVENLVEKELGLKSKKDIVNYGIEKFNEVARQSVMRYADEWRTIVPRLGRFIDMDSSTNSGKGHDYRTMDASYTETVWWIFKRLHDKHLIYEGFKSMNLCPRCETTLSNFEVAQGYKDITDISVTVKFRVKDEKFGGKDSSDTFLLAWTTTPWTLPGNVALAVNSKIDYIKVRIAEQGTFILAKDRLSILKDAKYEVVETIRGTALIGIGYEPLFDYYSNNTNLKDRANGWKVYGADFVTTEDGTGIVHIAPAFGADDYMLLQRYKLPFVQHVTTDGKFKKEVSDFSGMSVKPIDTKDEKDAHQKADVEIIKWLAHHDLLFAKEKLIHSYPHCWRCDTPLLNYASSSWFVKVTDLKGKLVAENKKVTWVPPEVGEGRFGNWLEGARDWAISRSRFWGAPIPVWREEYLEKDGKNLSAGKTNYRADGDTEKIHVVGSVEDLKKYSKAKNTYYVMRHGEAENNEKGVLDGSVSSVFRLTDKGRQQVADSAKNFKKLHEDVLIDLVIVSPILRTRETADIFIENFGLTKDKIVIDERIREYDPGILDGHKISELKDIINGQDRFTWKPDGGENYQDIKKRMGDFLYEMENKYSNKSILIVTHETPALLLFSSAYGLTLSDTKSLRPSGDFIANAEIRKLDFTPLPHNDRHELDLHRPFIDDLQLRTDEGNRLVRVPDVFDCWFESGAMPYASNHYPFENVGFEPKPGPFKKPRGYPADFIAEGLDQTRGWFYSMMVLGVALFGKTPYKKVIVNGLVLAEDGQKMSKRKQNYPDPMRLVDKYGADSLRFYLLSSPVVHGEDLCFSERGVDEVTKKIVNRLLNVVSFYEMYVGGLKARDILSKVSSSNVLDLWILNRLNETISIVTKALEAGELDKAVRPFMDFTDDLSTWYIRRSRDRFKALADKTAKVDYPNDEDKDSALATTCFVLLTTAKILAPFMPFLSEEIYSRVGGDLESVHLEEWPTANAVDSTSIGSMNIVRGISSKALEARMKVKINVRQPLAKLKVRDTNLKDLGASLIGLIKDEVNIKEVSFDSTIVNDIELDTVITPELKEEGIVRELIRIIQDLRKKKGLTMNDRVVLFVGTDNVGKDLVEKNRSKLMATTSLREIKYDGTGSEEFRIGDLVFRLSI